MNPKTNVNAASTATDCSPPSRCPEHPDAYVKKTWLQKQYVMNGYPTGKPMNSDVRYYCDTCGLELTVDGRDLVPV